MESEGNSTIQTLCCNGQLLYDTEAHIYKGTPETTMNYTSINISISATQNGTLHIDQSIADGNIWDITDEYQYIPAESPQIISISVKGLVFRVRFTNTATNNTNTAVNSIRLQTILRSGGGGGASALADLTDVIIADPAVDDILTYTGTQWTNSTYNSTVPPVVFDIANSYKTSTDIYIALTTPTQHYNGLFSYPLPVITSCKFQVIFKADNMDPVGATLTVLDSSSVDFDASYVRTQSINGHIPTNQPLEGIVLSKISPTNLTPTPVNFLQDNVNVERKSITFNTPLPSGAINNFIVGVYRNFSSTSADSSYNFGIYLESRPPSADASLTFVSATDISIRFNINRPTKADTLNDNNQNVTIKKYNISYPDVSSSISLDPTTSNSYAYDIENPNNAASLPVNLGALYPDTSYNLNVISYNSADLSAVGIPNTFSTTFINSDISYNNLQILYNTPDAFFSTLPFPLTAYKYSDNTQVTYLYNNVDVVSKPLTLPINTDKNYRGKYGIGIILMDLSASTTGNSRSYIKYIGVDTSPFFTINYN